MTQREKIVQDQQPDRHHAHQPERHQDLHRLAPGRRSILVYQSPHHELPLETRSPLGHMRLLPTRSALQTRADYTF
jgi:hypothetical protein